jgi:superfamily II DNA helicase RecQ
MLSAAGPQRSARSVDAYERRVANVALSDEEATLLLSWFGYGAFRPNQRAYVNALLSNDNYFLGMPTGSGKTFIFMAPILARALRACNRTREAIHGLQIVVAPLVELQMQHQSMMRAAVMRAGNALAGVEVLSDLDEGRLKEIKNLWNGRLVRTPTSCILFLRPETWVMLRRRAHFSLVVPLSLSLDEFHAFEDFCAFRSTMEGFEGLRIYVPPRTPIVLVSPLCAPDVVASAKVFFSPDSRTRVLGYHEPRENLRFLVHPFLLLDKYIRNILSKRRLIRRCSYMSIPTRLWATCCSCLLSGRPGICLTDRLSSTLRSSPRSTALVLWRSCATARSALCWQQGLLGWDFMLRSTRLWLLVSRLRWVRCLTCLAMADVGVTLLLALSLRFHV